jgi:hypothetical protein
MKIIKRGNHRVLVPTFYLDSIPGSVALKAMD